MGRPLVSIIICTYNHAESLARTLESVARLKVPNDMTTELIVVDNRSTDSTPDVVRRCDITSMPVRYSREPRPGVSHARNLGMREAAGDIFLWTDDDVRPERDWIDRMCRPILSGSADAVAGRLRNAPHLVKPWPARTRLLQRHHQGTISGATLVGGNMAFSRRVLARVPAFEAELGPGALGFADDTLFSHQLHAAGFTILDEPDIEADHFFDAQRLTRAGLLAEARKHGRSNAFLRYHWRHQERPWQQLSLAAYRTWHAAHWLAQPMAWRRSECSRMEYRMAEGMAAFQQYIFETRRPRLYEKYGLKRLA